MDWRGAATRRYARLATDTVTRWPLLWPLLRPTMRWRFDTLAPHWDRIRSGAGLAALEAALADAPEPRRILDLGTGTGDAALLAARRFPHAEVVGVDLAPAMVAEAKRKLPPELAGRIRFAAADAAALPFADGEFDLVTLANMIPFWDELARVVGRGGAVAIAYGAGERTPIYVPADRLRAELGRRGFSQFANFEVGVSTALLARKEEGR